MTTIAVNHQMDKLLRDVKLEHQAIGKAATRAKQATQKK